MRPKHLMLVCACAAGSLLCFIGQVPPLCAVSGPPAQAASAEKVDYSSGVNWLCRPGRQDACAADLSTTVISSSGRLTREDWKQNPNAPIDCFYVYPTVSRESSYSSDLIKGSEEKAVVRDQLARFGSVCRLYAPVYRQVTLAGLISSEMSGKPNQQAKDLAYGDIRDAWNEYLDYDNQGRGVILIGHSQGASLLTRLVAETIDGKPAQEKIVAAYLIGTSILVPQGAVVGGTLKKMPLCQSSAQTGCVIAYSSFSVDSPPPTDSIFGRTDERDRVVACTNPASLAGGSGELHSYLLASGPWPWTSFNPPGAWLKQQKPIQTPFVSLPGMMTAECVHKNDASYLAVAINQNPADQRLGELGGEVVVDGKVMADWGLHLIDLDLAMGNLVGIASLQAQAWSSRPH
jgi:hypothetical protein